jgi:hypothetical protein
MRLLTKDIENLELIRYCAHQVKVYYQQSTDAQIQTLRGEFHYDEKSNTWGVNDIFGGFVTKNLIVSVDFYKLPDSKEILNNQNNARERLELLLG